MMVSCFLTDEILRNSTQLGAHRRPSYCKQFHSWNRNFPPRRHSFEWCGRETAGEVNVRVCLAVHSNAGTHLVHHLCFCHPQRCAGKCVNANCIPQARRGLDVATIKNACCEEVLPAAIKDKLHILEFTASESDTSPQHKRVHRQTTETNALKNNGSAIRRPVPDMPSHNACFGCCTDSSPREKLQTVPFARPIGLPWDKQLTAKNFHIRDEPNCLR